MPTLKEYLVGDLGPARRHLERLAKGILQPAPAVLDEISTSVERCVQRIGAEVLEPANVRAALRDLSHPAPDGNSLCWCDYAIGNPMVPDHTARCNRIRVFYSTLGS